MNVLLVYDTSAIDSWIDTNLRRGTLTEFITLLWPRET